MSRPLRGLGSLVLTGLLAAACAAPSAPRTRADADSAQGGSADPLRLSLRTEEPIPGIWLSVSDVAALPTSGPAWEQVKSVADESPGVASVKDWESNHDVRILAAALVYARTGEDTYRRKAVQGVLSAIGTEEGGDTLALSRNAVPYIIAADLVDLSGSDDRRFRAWLRETLDEVMSDGRTVREIQEDRPNNHGTHAGAWRTALAVYLEDTWELARAAQVFKGWLGDRSSWASFRFGDLSWQCDALSPVAVNPVGCRKDGHSIDGVLPDDQRRSGGFKWPPAHANYVYEALQGAIVQAEILSRAGYPAWAWEDQALLRAYRWLHETAGFPATGDDEWQIWLVNRRYEAGFPVKTPAEPGKNMGWTDWTHGS